MSVDDDLCQRLGWLGNVTIFRATQDAARVIRAKAADLGLEITADGEAAGTWQVRTGTPETWQAAQKLLAYLDGLMDAGVKARSEPVATPEQVACCLSDDEFAARVAKALGSPAVTKARVNEIRAAKGLKPWAFG